MRKLFFMCLFASALLPLVGCTAKPPQPVAVHGRLLDAKEQGLANVIKRFVSAIDEQSADSVTQKNGAFTLSCRPGVYRVILMTVPTVSVQGMQLNQKPRPRVQAEEKKKEEEHKNAEIEPEEEKEKRKDERFADRYQDAALTPWQNIEIKAKGPNEITLVVAP